jgi:membrane protease YdiL (CAAX protease family)
VSLGIGDAPTPLRILLSYVPLWLGLLIPTGYAVWRKGNGFVKDLGLRFEWIDLPLGLGIGVACQLVLMPLIYVVVNKVVPGQNVGAVAQQVTDQAVDPLSTVMIFLVVGLGAPLVEEIYYRGLTLRAAERRFGPSWALLGTSAFFALMHGAPIVVPGLLVFALILGYLAQRFGRLGPSIFAHIGFNLVTAVVLIFGINFAWIS